MELQYIKIQPQSCFLFLYISLHEIKFFSPYTQLSTGSVKLIFYIMSYNCVSRSTTGLLLGKYHKHVDLYIYFS